MTGPNAAFRNFTVLIAMARTAPWLMTTRVLAGITFWSSASPGLYCCGDRAARHLWDSDSRTTSGGSCRAPMLGGMPPTADIKEELTARSSRRWRGPPLLACARAAMTARSPQRDEAGFFTDPSEASQRRYEALRGVFVDGLSYAEAGRRFGYARWAMVDLARQLRAGRLWLFAPPGRPGRRPGAAPKKEAVRARVIELRREGLSSYEISVRLSSDGTPLNRTWSGRSSPRRASAAC